MENTRKDKLMNRTDKLVSFKIPVAWFFNLTFIFTLPLGLTTF